MIPLRLGVQLASLKLPFKQALLASSQLGAAAVEIDGREHLRPHELTGTALRQVRKMLDDLNLRVSAVSFRTRRGFDVAEDLERRVEATKAAMKMAYDLGASVLINQIGSIPTDPSAPEWTRMGDALEDIGRHGQRVGVLLAAETGSEPGERLAEFLHALPEGSLAINFDPANLILNAFSVPDALAALAPHVVHVHAKDAVRDLARKRGVEVELGRGSVDFPDLLATLEEQGYRGYVTVERENATRPVDEVAQGLEYLRGLFR